MESRHCGQDKEILFCPVHSASTPCSLQAFGITSARMHGHMTSRKRVKILICIIEAVFVSTNKRETLRPVLKEREFSPLQ